MTQFIIRRLILFVPALLGILLITFVLARLIPGDPCAAMLGERATPEQCNAFRERFGLNDSLPVQFIRYMTNFLQGDFGNSIRNKRPVDDILLERLPMTLEVTIGAMLFSTVFGITFGIISAVRRNSAIDVATMMGANVGVSMPVFWLGLMLEYVFALALKDTVFWLPPSGRLSSGVSVTPLSAAWGLENLSGPLLGIVTFVSNTVTFNALITGQINVFIDAIRHLILP
jgi:peptide/nickel transport system permease protein